MHPTVKPKFIPLPKTKPAFVNVPLMVPVLTRAGELRYLSAAWGGALHLFSPDTKCRDQDKVIPFPKGCLGTYTFVPAVEPGYAWIVFGRGGSIIARLNLDTGQYDVLQEQPLKKMNLSGAITSEGFLTCGDIPGNVMVYDTKAQKVKYLFQPICKDAHYAWFQRAAPDGCVVAYINCPKTHFFRIDPRTGRVSEHTPPFLQRVNGLRYIPFTFINEQEIVQLDEEGVLHIVNYPEFKEIRLVDPPGDKGPGWTTRVDYYGNLFLNRDEPGPLWRLSRDGVWQEYLTRFTSNLGPTDLACILAEPNRPLFALAEYGELFEYEPDGTARPVGELDNWGYLSIDCVQPASGSRIFVTSFINHSFQELDWKTGQGKNIQHCAKHPGEVLGTAWIKGRLYLANYTHATISVYDPEAGGQWPENPRHLTDIGHEQNCPMGMAYDGKYLWVISKADYGKFGGALTRFNPANNECQVWRNLVPDHNPLGMIFDPDRRCIYMATTIHSGGGAGPPVAKDPAAVFAFHIDHLKLLWVAHPEKDAKILNFGCLTPEGHLLVHLGEGPRYILLEAETGKVLKHLSLQDWSPAYGTAAYFCGSDGATYVAFSEKGLFPLDIETGKLGPQIIQGPVLKPTVHENTLFFIRGHKLGVVEGLFAR